MKFIQFILLMVSLLLTSFASAVEDVGKCFTTAAAEIHKQAYTIEADGAVSELCQLAEPADGYSIEAIHPTFLFTVTPSMEVRTTEPPSFTASLHCASPITAALFVPWMGESIFRQVS